MAAVRELEAEQTYSGKIRFTIVPNTRDGFADEVASYEFGSHGLVGFDQKGRVATKIGGHAFGKSEIVTAITTLIGR